MELAEPSFLEKGSFGSPFGMKAKSLASVTGPVCMSFIFYRIVGIGYAHSIHGMIIVSLI